MSEGKGATVFGSPFFGGQQYGYGAPIRCRRVIDVIVGQPDSNAENSGQSDIAVNVDALNSNRWPDDTPTVAIDFALPIRIPHESTIVSIELLHGATQADTMKVEVFRDDTDITTSSFTQSLMSGGPDLLWPVVPTERDWVAINGLDTFLDIVNQRFTYWIGVRINANQTTILFAARVDYDVPYISGM